MTCKLEMEPVKIRPMILITLGDDDEKITIKLPIMAAEKLAEEIREQIQTVRRENGYKT